MELLETGDGSHTYYIPELDETYHSRKGARTESEYVYLKQGLDVLSGDTIQVVEFGFGTGLNAWLTLAYARANQKSILYTSAERYPLSEEQWKALNHGASDDRPEWQRLMEADWESPQELDPSFVLEKRQCDFLELENRDADVIFYDAFAPKKQPEVWTPDYLEHAYAMLKSEGILVTYCASGQFKRDLKAIGFEVETLPGPPGKTEMTRAARR